MQTDVTLLTGGGVTFEPQSQETHHLKNQLTWTLFPPEEMLSLL